MAEELAVTPDAGEIAARDEQLAGAALAGIEQKDLQLPQIKVAQQLTREVTEGDAESGQFLNTVTGDNYGTQLDFVVVHYFKGRLLAPKDEDRVWVAAGPVAPDSWPEEYAGKAFADIPDAEEQHRVRANDPDDDFEWGSGPLIQTTHNYVGFVVGEPGLPARISLKGTSAPAAKKINTLISFAGTAPWSRSIRLETELREIRKKPFYVVKATQGEQSDNEVVAAAQNLAQRVQEAGAFQLTGDSDEEQNVGAGKGAETPDGGVDL